MFDPLEIDDKPTHADRHIRALYHRQAEAARLEELAADWRLNDEGFHDDMERRSREMSHV